MVDREPPSCSQAVALIWVWHLTCNPASIRSQRCGKVSWRKWRSSEKHKQGKGSSAFSNESIWSTKKMGQCCPANLRTNHLYTPLNLSWNPYTLLVCKNIKSCFFWIFWTWAFVKVSGFGSLYLKSQTSQGLDTIWQFRCQVKRKHPENLETLHPRNELWGGWTGLRLQLISSGPGLSIPQPEAPACGPMGTSRPGGPVKTLGCMSYFAVEECIPYGDPYRAPNTLSHSILGWFLGLKHLRGYLDNWKNKRGWLG